MIELSVINLLAGAGAGVGGKIIFDWLSNRGKIPLSKNGFVTLTDLKAHCADQQTAYREVFGAQIGALTASVSGLREEMKEIKDWLNRHTDRLT